MLSRTSRIRSLSILALVATASVVALVAHAKAPPAPAPAAASLPHGSLWLRTKLGSFKALQRGADPIEGHFEVSFTGSFLIVGLEGKTFTVTSTGNLRKEYEEKPHHRTVYYGSGKLVIDGQFKSMQFFGQDLSGVFNGYAVFRLYGEFDRDLKTGDFSYDNYKTNYPWGTNGPTAIVPPPTEANPGAPILKKAGGAP